MSGSLVNKSTVIVHAIAITTAVAIFSGRLPLTSTFSQSNLQLNLHPGRISSNP